jgi:hypothetical protein
MQIQNTNESGKQALMNAAGGLGALVWWSLAQTAITPDRLRAILADEGADASIVPNIDSIAAIRRAARDWAQGRGKADRFRAEVASESAGSIVVGILRREQPSVGEVRWTQVDAVVFDGPSATWTTTGTTPEASSFRSQADEMRTHLDHLWIRPHIVQRGLVDASAVCLRDRGGVYYVPAQREAELSRLAKIVSRIGACHLDIVHAQATDASRASISTGAQASLRDELGQTVAQITAWAEAARKVRDDSGAAVLAELADLRARASLYEDALSVSMADLQAAIAAARVEAERLIGAPKEPAPRASGSDQEREKSYKQAKASAPTVEALRALLASRTPNADGGYEIPAADVAATGLKVRSVTSIFHWYWQPGRGAGADAAAQLGFVSRLRSTPLALILSPAGSAPVVEPPADVEDADGDDDLDAEAIALAEPEPVDDSDVEQDIDEDDLVDAEESASDIRERLASMSPAQVRSTYEALVGPSGLACTKVQMIEAIVSGCFLIA